MKENNHIEGNTKCGSQAKLDGVATRATEQKTTHGMSDPDRTSGRTTRRSTVVSTSTHFVKGVQAPSQRRNRESDNGEPDAIDKP